MYPHTLVDKFFEIRLALFMKGIDAFLGFLRVVIHFHRMERKALTPLIDSESALNERFASAIAVGLCELISLHQAVTSDSN